MTYWHGGKPNIKGGLILPADATGEIPACTYADEPHKVRTDVAYVTDSRYWAEFFAAWYPAKAGGWVYEVDPDLPLTADPDWLGCVGRPDEPNPAFMCPGARIIRRFTLPALRRSELMFTTKRPFALVSK